MDRRQPGRDYYNVYGEPVPGQSRQHRPPSHNVYVQPPQHVMQGPAHLGPLMPEPLTLTTSLSSLSRE